MRLIALFSSDWHAGHAGGVMAENTVLQYNDPGEDAKEYRPNLNDSQLGLLNLTNDILATVEKFAGSDPVILVQSGDIVHGNRWAEFLVSSRMSHQVSIALQYFDYIASRVNIQGFFTVHGTDVHVFGEGSAEEIISQMVRDRYNIESVCAPHLRLDLGGAIIDIAHNGPQTGTAWTEGNSARLYLRKVLMADSDTLGKRPAALYVRGHVHGFADETAKIERGGRWHHSRLLVIPAMCAINNHGRQTTLSQPYTRHGMVVAEIIDGQIGRVVPMIRTVDNRKNYAAGVVAYKYQGSPRK